MGPSQTWEFNVLRNIRDKNEQVHAEPPSAKTPQLRLLNASELAALF